MPHSESWGIEILFRRYWRVWREIERNRETQGRGKEEQKERGRRGERAASSEEQQVEREGKEAKPSVSQWAKRNWEWEELVS